MSLSKQTNKQTKEKEISIKKHSLPSFSFYFAHFFRKVSTFHSYINTNVIIIIIIIIIIISNL